MGSQKHQFWGPKSVNQPSKTPRGQVGWNDGETVAGGFGRGRLVVVGFPFPWFTTFFFFLGGERYLQSIVWGVPKNKSSWPW